MPDVVLTVAHCLIGTVPKRTLIEAGFVNIMKKGPFAQKRVAKKFFIHGEYKTDNSYELALIKLQKPFDFHRSEGLIGTVCLPETAAETSLKFTVVGWQAERVGEFPRMNLLAINASVKAHSKCGKTMSKARGSSKTFCGRICKERHCHLAYGSSAVVITGGFPTFSTQIGVSAGVQPVGTEEAYYIKLSHFSAWIQKKLEQLKQRKSRVRG